MKGVTLDASMAFDLAPYLVTCKNNRRSPAMESIMLALGAKKSLDSGDLLDVLLHVFGDVVLKLVEVLGVVVEVKAVSLSLVD